MAEVDSLWGFEVKSAENIGSNSAPAAHPMTTTERMLTTSGVDQRFEKGN